MNQNLFVSCVEMNLVSDAEMNRLSDVEMNVLSDVELNLPSHVEMTLLSNVEINQNLVFSASSFFPLVVVCGAPLLYSTGWPLTRIFWRECCFVGVIEHFSKCTL